MTPPLLRRFVPTSVGPIRVATCGTPEAPAVLLLHPTPRSWREFEAVLPRLGAHRFAIAMHTVGFGDSPAPPWPPTIERWAGVAHELLDAMSIEPDGAHLQSLWLQRQPFYPADRPELLQAFVADALRAHGEPAAGHHVVAAYAMETRIGRVRQPTLVVRATADRFAAPRAEALRARLHDARIVDVEGGGVALPDQMPEAFAAVVEAFLADDSV